MAKAFVVWIGNLAFKLGAHTFRIFGFFATARTVPARFFKPLLYHINDGFVGIKRNFHSGSIPKN